MAKRAIFNALNEHRHVKTQTTRYAARKKLQQLSNRSAKKMNIKTENA